MGTPLSKIPDVLTHELSARASAEPSFTKPLYSAVADEGAEESAPPTGLFRAHVLTHEGGYPRHRRHGDDRWSWVAERRAARDVVGRQRGGRIGDESGR